MSGTDKFFIGFPSRSFFPALQRRKYEFDYILEAIKRQSEGQRFRLYGVENQVIGWIGISCPYGHLLNDITIIHGDS